jgi:hypothetical protein
MTIKRSITVEVEMTSGASEASLKTHLDEFVNEIKYNTENMKYASWYKIIHTSYDEQENVEISVKTTAN